MQHDINKIFNSEILKELKEYAHYNSKEELCGFIYFKNNKEKLYKCQNIASDKTRYFIINPEDFDRCSFKGKIICCFHSHINNRGFSSEDIDQSFKNNIPYLLYNLKQDQFYFFDPIKNEPYKKYINIPYRNGHDDCWSIVQKFYKNEFNANLSDPEPDRFFYEDEYEWNRIKKSKCNYDPFSWEYEVRKEFFNSNNLFKIDFDRFNQLEKGDILIIKYAWQPFATFGSIYLGEGLVLEHINQQPSKIYSLRKGHEKAIQYILRYKHE